MTKAIAAATALLLAAVAMVLPTTPASAAGTTYSFNALAQGQHVAFDPAVDTLHVDSPVISAASVRVTDVLGNLAVSAAAKTVYLDGTSLRGLSTTSMTFADGSVLRVGDDSGNVVDLSASTKANQLIGLGGADDLTGGNGPDRFVGGGAKPALEHVSRAGATGSPTASTNPSVSLDGNVIAFEGGWTAFGSTDDNGTDVFAKRIDSGSVTDEHRTSAGTNGLSGSGSSQLSADGRYLAFVSSSQLVGGSPPSSTIYRADTLTNEITAVSTTSGGAFANGASGQPDISADGRYVVFTSAATNLASGSTGTTYDIFRKDLQTGTVLRLSTSLTGGDANADCATPRISADGSLVAFSSTAANLDTQNTGSGHTDVFVFDATNVPASIENWTGSQPGAFDSRNPDVGRASGSGPTIAFETGKSLVDADTNNQTDVYVYRGGLGFSIVSTKADGTGVALASQEPAVSDDGRFVAFRTFSDSLAPGDADGYADVVVKDRATGNVALISTPASGASNQSSGAPEISVGGDWIAFESSASNLAATDANGNVNDVFRVANPLAFDTLRGKGGNDTYAVAPGSGDQLVETAGEGTDAIETSGTYVLTAPNVENVVAPPGINAHDDFTGNSGNNRLDPGLGSDTMRASAGDDTYVADVNTDVITGESTASGIDTVEAGLTWTLQAYLENLTLTGSGAFNATGNSGNNVLAGNSGANRLTGYSGNDTLIEKGGNDILDGGTGNDTYVFSGAAGAITGESGTTLGTDTVKSAVTWTLQAYLENLTLTGSATTNGTGNTANNVLTGNTANNVLVGGSGADTYTGGGGADTFTIDTSATVDVVNDFTVGTDKFRMRQSAWSIGDGDLLVEGATNKTGPGGFSRSAEYVVISKNLTSLTTTNAAAAIGSATSAFATGNRRVFMVDNGTTSQLYLFISSGNDAKVSSTELKPLMTFKNRNAMSVTSLAFAA